MKKSVCFVSALAFVFSMATISEGQCCPKACGKQMVSIFDGKTLTGWQKKGGPATYTVEDGMIVGVPHEGQGNTFLCTDKLYGDFILDIDFFQHSINSGVQIRSESYAEFKDFRVHGYQVEMDPGSRAWSGGIYDESRRAWIFNLQDNDAARNAYKSEAWNHFRIAAVGDSIKTWINGVEAADLVDSMTLKGFIGLQIHATKNINDQYCKWKNIQICDQGEHVWQSLWDLTTLSPFDASGDVAWESADGVMTASSDGPGQGQLVSKEACTDFTVRMMFKVVKGSGAFTFRTYQGAEDQKYYGYRVPVDDQKDGMTGGLIETGVRDLMMQPYKGLEKDWNNREWMEYKPGEWNKLTVSCHEHRIVVFINDRMTAEIKHDPGLKRYEPKETVLDRMGFVIGGEQASEIQVKQVEQLVKAK